VMAASLTAQALSDVLFIVARVQGANCSYTETGPVTASEPWPDEAKAEALP
jgi:hypothetical protein